MLWNDRSSWQIEEYEAILACLQATTDSYNGCSVVLGEDWNVAKHTNYPAESFVSQFCFVWRLNGCPRSGVFNENRINPKLRYKCAIKEAVIAADEDFNENLVNHLCKMNFNDFWKAWHRRFCSKDLKLKPTSRLRWCLHHQYCCVGDVNILAEVSNHFSQLGECNTPGIDDKYRSLVSEHLHLNFTPGQPVYQ